MCEGCPSMHQVLQVAPVVGVQQERQLTGATGHFHQQGIWLCTLCGGVLWKGKAVEETQTARFSGFVCGPQGTQRHFSFVD